MPAPKKTRICPECGSTDIVEAISVSQTSVSGAIGLSYKTMALLTASAPLYADLCHQCGTVIRFFVRDPSKPWVRERENLHRS
jgi:hypothetical protein